MDEKNENKRKLIVIDRTEEEISEVVEEKTAPKVSHKIEQRGQTNPIYKNLAKFQNTKIGDKLSVKDLLR